MKKSHTTTTCTIYPEDLVKVKEWREELRMKNKANASPGGNYIIPNLADVLRIAIEYSQAHGVFT